MKETFYAVGQVHGDEITTYDLIEEWPSTFDPVKYESAEEAMAHWNQCKPHFKYSAKGDKILKITIEVEEIDLLK